MTQNNLIGLLARLQGDSVTATVDLTPEDRDFYFEAMGLLTMAVMYCYGTFDEEATFSLKYAATKIDECRMGAIHQLDGIIERVTKQIADEAEAERRRLTPCKWYSCGYCMNAQGWEPCEDEGQNGFCKEL